MGVEQRLGRGAGGWVEASPLAETIGIAAAVAAMVTAAAEAKKAAKQVGVGKLGVGKLEVGKLGGRAARERRGKGSVDPRPACQPGWGAGGGERSHEAMHATARGWAASGAVERASETRDGDGADSRMWRGDEAGAVGCGAWTCIGRSRKKRGGGRGGGGGLRVREGK